MLLQLPHMNCFRSGPSLTPDLMAIFCAISTYLFERAASDLTISLASVRSVSMRSRAICRTLPLLLLRVKALLVLSCPDWARENAPLQHLWLPHGLAFESVVSVLTARTMLIFQLGPEDPPQPQQELLVRETTC